MRFCSVLITIIAVAIVGFVAYGLRSKDRRRGTAIRLLRRPIGKKCGLSKTSVCNYDILQIENEHKTAKGIFSTCLFIKGDRLQFIKQYLTPLLRSNKKKPSPDWYYRVYVPVDFDLQVKQLMLSQDFEVVTMASKAVSYFPFYWRFLPLFGNRPFLCCDGDCDTWSWMWKTVERWSIDEDKAFVHFPLPGLHFLWPVTAPTWGCNPNRLTTVAKKKLYKHMIEFSQKCCTFGCDELFLAEFIHPCFAEYGCVKHNAAFYFEFSLLVFIIGLFLLSNKSLIK